MTGTLTRTLMRRVKDLTSIRKLREGRYERVFSSVDGFGHCRGVFDSFAQARRSAPMRALVGFDHDAFAHDFGERFAKVLPHDYPMLFWLRRCLSPGCKVFDVGGHTGSQFHVYRLYLEYPADLEWRVCEVPKVVERGRELAEARGHTQLRFTCRLDDAEGADVLLAAGSLQYIEAPTLAELLSGLKRKPTHLLLNKLPLYDGPAHVTLQNGGPVFVPQHVFNRGELVSQLEQLGYQLADAWEVPGFSTQIPFRPDRSVPRFSGVYLRRNITRGAGY